MVPMGERLAVADRRIQLVDAALAVAVADGISATSVRRVAEQAGVALGVVHYAFADKDELIAALAERIVDALADAGAAAVAATADQQPGDLLGALRAALDGLWTSIEVTPQAQLLTYEITTHALRTPGLHGAAERQYQVSQRAAEQLLELTADSCAARWDEPVTELAAAALAFVDGVTLRWLVDRDSTAARARLDRFAGYLASRSTG
jgi:AcrR family transcriptional regulator